MILLRECMQQGLTMEQYFQFTGLTEEKMLEDLQPAGAEAHSDTSGSGSNCPG